MGKDPGSVQMGKCPRRSLNLHVKRRQLLKGFKKEQLVQFCIREK